MASLTPFPPGGGRRAPRAAGTIGSPPAQVYAMLLSSFIWFTIRSGRYSVSQR